MPSLAEVKAWAASYPGDMARAVPGPIPEEFAEQFWERKEHDHGWLRNGRAIDWRGELAGARWWRGQWREWSARKTVPSRLPGADRQEFEDLRALRDAGLLEGAKKRRYDDLKSQLSNE